MSEQRDDVVERTPQPLVLWFPGAYVRSTGAGFSLRPTYIKRRVWQLGACTGTMEFTLSSSNPLKTTFTNAADGREYYRVETKYRLLCIPQESTILSSRKPEVTHELARIRWYVVAPTIFEY